MNVPFQKELESASAPIIDATGIPNWFYTSEDALEEEKKKLFSSLHLQ